MKKEIIKVFLLFSILTLILTYPLILSLTNSVSTGMFSYYDVYLNVWIITRNIHAIFTSPLDFFNANIFAPNKYTLTYSEHMLGNSLLVLPFRVFTENPVLLYNICFMLTFVLTATGIYFLYRYISGNSKIAFLAGIFFTFSVIRFRYVQLLQILSFQWIPLSLLFFVKFIKSGRSRELVLFLLFLLISSLTSIYNTLMFGIYFLCFFLFFFIFERKHFKKKFFMKFIPAFIFTLFLILLLHLPYLETLRSGFYISSSSRGGEVLSNSATLHHYSKIFSHSILWSRLFPAFTSESGLFPGVVLLFLYVTGIFFILRNEKGYEKGFFIATILAGLFCWLLSFGARTFFYSFMTEVMPLLKGIRVPDRFSNFFLFSIALVTARGVEYLNKEKLSILILVLFLIENAGIPLHLKKVPEITEPERVYLYLKNQPDDIIVLELPMPGNRDEMWLEVKYTISSVHHWKRIANGYSGYFPESYHKIRESVFHGFPQKETLLFLKKNGIKLIIIHTEYFDMALWNELLKFIEKSPLIYIGNFGSDRVYMIPDEVRE